jgi:solute carrier family 25 (peroxisomal adenine nucleotide transporter), member 17
MVSDAALDALGHAASGSVGTAISTAALYPLDLAITRLKAQRHLPKRDRHDGVVSTLRQVLSQEGVAALYSGLGPDIAKSVIDSFLFFGFYNYLRPRHRKPRMLEELGLGALAGACARAVTTPISNVVTLTQANTGSEGFKHILAGILERSGVLGLWSGYSATLVLTMNPSITFLINRRLARKIIPALEEEDIPVAWVAFVLAASSKATASAITYPFQTGKTRLQMANQEVDPEKGASKTLPTVKGGSAVRHALRRLLEMLDQSIFGVVISILKDEGVRNLYTGLQGELFKGFFSHGLTMLTKGLIHRLIVRMWLTFSPQLRSIRLQKK